MAKVPAMKVLRAVTQETLIGERQRLRSDVQRVAALQETVRERRTNIATLQATLQSLAGSTDMRSIA